MEDTFALNDLPRDLLPAVLRRLPYDDVQKVRLVSKTFNEAVDRALPFAHPHHDGVQGFKVGDTVKIVNAGTRYSTYWAFGQLFTRRWCPALQPATGDVCTVTNMAFHSETKHSSSEAVGPLILVLKHPSRSGNMEVLMGSGGVKKITPPAAE